MTLYSEFTLGEIECESDISQMDIVRITMQCAFHIVATALVFVFALAQCECSFTEGHVRIRIERDAIDIWPDFFRK